MFRDLTRGRAARNDSDGGGAVPSLRNVALVLGPNLARQPNGIPLTTTDKQALVAFFSPLIDGIFATETPRINPAVPRKPPLGPPLRRRKPRFRLGIPPVGHIKLARSPNEAMFPELACVARPVVLRKSGLNHDRRNNNGSAVMMNFMKTNRWILAAGMAGLLFLGAEKVRSQGPPPWAGGFDPAQIQKFMMEGFRQQLEITDDAEWQVVEGRIQKVMDSRIETGFGGMNMMRRMFRRGGNGNASQDPGPGRGPEAFGFKQSDEESALQKAVDDKASKAALKTALDKFLESRREKQAKLEKAREELRGVLSTRQEAIAALLGLL